MSTQIQPYESMNTELTMTRTPGVVLAEAEQAAAALMKLVDSRELFKQIGKTKHLYVEAWETVGHFYRCHARIVETVPITLGNDHGWKARAELVHMDTGQVLGCAEALCMTDEDDWRERPVYEWVDNKKRQVGVAPVPQYARCNMAQCVPLDAEILTRSGFRSYDEIAVGDEVLSYDCEADTCRWVVLEAVSVYEDQPLVAMKSRSLSVVCTPEHTWPTRRYQRSRNSRISYQSLVKCIDLPAIPNRPMLVVAAKASGGDSPITSEEAAVLGWMITDGTMRHSNSGKVRVHIDQSKAPYVEEIRELVGVHASSEQVKGAGQRTFPTGRTYATRPSHRFNLRQEYVDDLLAKAGVRIRADFPALATRLSQPARAAMLAAMLHADGSNKRSGNRSGAAWVFGKQNPHVVETFQILAALEGRALGRASVDSTGLVRQCLRVNRHLSTGAIRFEEVGRGPVWCPTTPLGTWIMRWRNQVIITGNTRARSRVFRSVFDFVAVLAGYDATPAEEVNGASAPPVQQPQAKQTSKGSGAVISEPQAKRLYAIGKKAGATDQEVKAILAGYGYTSSKQIEKSKYDEICKRVEKRDVPQAPPEEAAGPSKLSHKDFTDQEFTDVSAWLKSRGCADIGQVDAFLAKWDGNKDALLEEAARWAELNG